MASENSYDWQSKKNTVLERNSHMFDNSFMSDITLTCADSSRVFHAHKYVLATSSAVFSAMFYGDMPEKASNLHLLDTDEESLQEFLRFLYTDDIDDTMTWCDALKVMYLSKKYLIPSMTKKCFEILKEQVDPDNVFTILKEAKCFNEVDLEEKCWGVLDLETTEALNSEDFNEVSLDTLYSLLYRDDLTSKELDLFQAVFKWSEKQCLRKGLDLTGKNRRAMLGNAIYKIRVLAMSREDFLQHVSTSGLLTTEECADILQGIAGDDVPGLKWTDRTARLRAGLLHFTRFEPSCINVEELCWEHEEDGNDELAFTVNRPILFHGVRLFGDPEAAEDYSTQFNVSSEERDDDEQRDETEGVFVPERDRNGIGGYDIMFDEPTLFKANKSIVISAKIRGPPSSHGHYGEISVQRDDIVVTFKDRRSYSNRTEKNYGQFHKIYLSPA